MNKGIDFMLGFFIALIGIGIYCLISIIHWAIVSIWRTPEVSNDWKDRENEAHTKLWADNCERMAKEDKK